MNQNQIFLTFGLDSLVLNLISPVSDIRLIWIIFVFLSAMCKHKVEILQNYNFACFLYGCETWSSILREEPALRISENGAEEDVLT